MYTHEDELPDNAQRYYNQEQKEESLMQDYILPTVYDAVTPRLSTEKESQLLSYLQYMEKTLCKKK